MPGRRAVAETAHRPAPFVGNTMPTHIRWGLCCQFLDAPIRFRSATHRAAAATAAGAGAP